MIDYKKNLLFILVFISGFILFTVYSYTAEKMIYNETCTANWVIFNDQGRANLTIDFMYNKKNKTGTDVLRWIFLINLPAIYSVYFLDDRHRELDSQRINRMYRRASVGCNTSRDIRRQRKSGSLRLYILN